jgi:hypothetical protein
MRPRVAECVCPGPPPAVSTADFTMLYKRCMAGGLKAREIITFASDRQLITLSCSLQDPNSCRPSRERPPSSMRPYCHCQHHPHCEQQDCWLWCFGHHHSSRQNCAAADPFASNPSAVDPSAADPNTVNTSLSTRGKVSLAKKTRRRRNEVERFTD